jgi:multiple sugar transport system permease protein
VAISLFLKKGHRSVKKKIDFLPYALISPLIIFIILLALTPAAFTAVLAFFRVQPLNPPTKFSGLENFRDIAQNQEVIASLGNTFFYIVIGVTLTTILGIFFAVTLHRGFKGRSILIAILILPWALPGVVEGILWTGIWDANTGVLNSILKSLHIISEYQVFLGQNKLVTILAIEIVQVWQITPLSTILILAVLQNIPDDIYEAALIDGSGGIKAFKFITLPLIRPGIAIAMVQSIIATLNIFDQPYILNGAATTANSLAMQTYAVSFQNLNFGQGYALSLLITLFTLFVSVFVAKIVYKKVEY